MKDALALLQQLDSAYEKQEQLNIFQHTIQAIVVLHSQVNVGGYIQLIQNGMGNYLFENPFAEAIKYMGATALYENIMAAKNLYKEHQTILEKETTLQEFTQLYEQFPIFDTLLETYKNIIDKELSIIQAYIENHPSDFY